MIDNFYTNQPYNQQTGQGVLDLTHGRTAPKLPEPDFLALVIGGDELIIYGGPYANKPLSMVGVCVAMELHNLPAAVKVPIRDFKTPSQEEAYTAVAQTLMLALGGASVYVGCMGGRGRTGLLLALVTKTVFELNGTDDDPVQFVRDYYNPHAVETDAQEAFVEDFDVAPLVDWLEQTLQIKSYVPVEKPVTSWFSRLRAALSGK